MRPESHKAKESLRSEPMMGAPNGTGDGLALCQGPLRLRVCRMALQAMYAAFG